MRSECVAKEGVKKEEKEGLEGAAEGERGGAG